MFLGAVGMGIVSVYQTSILTMSQISSLGTPQSGVKEISNVEDDQREDLIYIFSRLLNLLSLIGVISMLIFSYPLSVFTFENGNHVYPLMTLSVAVGLHVLSQKQLAIMQATRQAKSIALTSLISAFASLCFGIVGYKYFGVSAIVPVLIGSYGAQFVTGKILLKKIKTNKHYNNLDILKKSRSILKLGVILMTSLILINVFNIIFNAFISQYGGLEDLGYYNAAFAITNGNILILLSVLTSDYFPRLSAVSKDIISTNQIVNQQTELIVLLTAPMVIFLIVAAPLVVRLLLSEKFYVIIPMLQLMSLGLLFRVIWQSMSYVLLAQGDKKAYFIFDALIGNGSVLIINVLMYLNFGLVGLGYSFVINSILVSGLLYLVVSKKFNVKFDNKFIQSALISICLAILAFLLYTYSNFSFLSYFIFLVSALHTINVIQKRGNFRLLSLLNKIKSK
ncbi:hypothetical protein GCM10022216_32200 [Sphingobacterium kyonggiense]|uniref:O-antigen/teichoic acid export membrane protein n=2 Tax=Sphingobacterium kyonggiense TaxID=714075 RepID=A0ABP7Z4H2_9SPHI